MDRFRIMGLLILADLFRVIGNYWKLWKLRGFLRFGLTLFAQAVERVCLLLEFEEAGGSDVGRVEFGHGEGGVDVVLFEVAAFELGCAADGDDARGGTEEGAVRADFGDGHGASEIDVHFPLGGYFFEIVNG